MTETISITKHGPLFNGQARTALTAYVRAAEEVVADAGVNLAQARLGSVLRNPTGFYESSIVTDRASVGEVIHDSTAYGPWLEGVSSRNQSTRFKGYHTFRMVTQQLDRAAGGIAQRILGPFLARMN